MAQFKDALCSLSPIAYHDLPTGESLPQFIREAFGHAELLLNSIPAPAAEQPTSFTPSPANSAHTAEETHCDPAQIHVSNHDQETSITKGWGKPYKFSAKENPLGVQVYKMAAHDRHGAWFARRSIHQGIGFSKWKKAASSEFLESLKVQKGPGSGAVRGVAADRRVESQKGPNDSTIDVWQTSSAFPGPVTPRESLTLLLASSNALSGSSNVSESDETTGSGAQSPRHFLVISRPTKHPDAPERPQLVKMEYESAEMIREIPVEGNDDPEANPVEWLMITRSDPGGGIPRFMVERGTPSSIVGDVGKFLAWATSKTEADLDRQIEDQLDTVADEHGEKTDTVEGKMSADEPSSSAAVETAERVGTVPQNSSEGDGGIVSKVTGVVESTVSGYLPAFQQQTGITSYSEDANESDTSSDISQSSGGTFRSAMDEQARSPVAQGGKDPWTDSTASLDPPSNGKVDHARTKSREIDKLLQKRAALEEKARKDRDSFAQKTADASEKESKERSKMIDKHEKQRQKQEERYRHELAKLDERRIKEERKEEEKRRKAEAKDEMKKLKQEISEWKSRCQIAEKEADLLRKQVETLQREHTAMAARLPEDDVKSLLSPEGQKRASSSKAASTKSGVSQ